MKITIVHGFFLPIPPVAGGAMEKIWWRLAREFAARGHEVVSVSRRWGDWPAEETREGVRLLRLPGRDHSRRLPINLIRECRWSLRVLRRLPPADVLVSPTVALPALAPCLAPATSSPTSTATPRVSSPPGAASRASRPPPPPSPRPCAARPRGSCPSCA